MFCVYKESFRYWLLLNHCAAFPILQFKRKGTERTIFLMFRVYINLLCAFLLGLRPTHKFLICLVKVK